MSKITRFRSNLLKFLNPIYINTRNAPSETKKRKRRRQKGGFLNRYDFAYAGRDVVNQTFKNLDKTAPALIQNLKGELNDILQQRIHEVIAEGGPQLKEVEPQLLKDSIENACKTPFRLLGNFGRTKLAEAKQQLNRELDKLKKHVKI